MPIFVNLMVGKRFMASDIFALHSQLVKYGLITNLDIERGIKLGARLTVRRLSDSKNIDRYSVERVCKDSRESLPYDVLVGTNVPGWVSLDLKRINPSTLEAILVGVREDIPDAEIIAYKGLS